MRTHRVPPHIGQRLSDLTVTACICLVVSAVVFGVYLLVADEAPAAGRMLGMLAAVAAAVSMLVLLANLVAFVAVRLGAARRSEEALARTVAQLHAGRSGPRRDERS